VSKKEPSYKTPFATLYYIDARGGLPIAVGGCRMPDKHNPLRNAKRSVAAQVFATEHYRRAEVVNRKTGKLEFSISRTIDGRINVNYECAGQVAENYQWRSKMEEKRRARKTRK
jgi:hypothetical protein